MVFFVYLECNCYFALCLKIKNVRMHNGSQTVLVIFFLRFGASRQSYFFQFSKVIYSNFREDEYGPSVLVVLLINMFQDIFMFFSSSVGCFKFMEQNNPVTSAQTVQKSPITKQGTHVVDLMSNLKTCVKNVCNQPKFTT